MFPRVQEFDSFLASVAGAMSERQQTEELSYLGGKEGA
jgi:hypothetical protein